MPRDSLERLIGLIAAEKNPHRLINRVASHEFLLEEARRAYLDQKRSMGISRAIELCGSYQIPYEYFQDRLRLIVHLLNLVSREEDYYRILGVDRTADLEAIKRSFRRLSRIYHPDVNPDDSEAPERFREIREAYEVLSTSELRERYDLHPANTPRVDEALLEKVSKTGPRHRRNLLHFGILIVLLVILSLVIDYQDLITSRYYRTKYGQAPTVAEQSVPPPVPELKVAKLPPENPIALPGDEVRNEEEKTPDTLQPALVAVAEKQPVEKLKEATSGVEDFLGLRGAFEFLTKSPPQPEPEKPIPVPAVSEIQLARIAPEKDVPVRVTEESPQPEPEKPSPVPAVLEIQLAQIAPEQIVVVPEKEESPQPEPEKPVSAPAFPIMRFALTINEDFIPAPVAENLQQPAEATPTNIQSEIPPKVDPTSQRPAQLKTPSQDSAKEQQKSPKEATPKPKPDKKIKVKPAEAKSDASNGKSVKSATATTQDKGPSVTDMKQRIQDFLNRYSRAYENKNSNALFSLFEHGAIENGEPVARLVPRYHDNFKRLENVRYSIRLVEWESSKKGLKVSGRFRLHMKLRGESPVVATGSMQLDLIHHGNDFRINRLAYNYEQSKREED